MGATVTLESGAGQQMERLVTGDSFSAQHSATVHFGIGAATRVDAIVIRWANGATRRIEQPQINQYHTVEPPSETN